VKICGVNDPDTAWAAAQAGADAIGLNFVEGSARRISLEQARTIVAELPAFVQPIGLFVNAEASFVQETASTLGLGTVQLHGDESPDYARSLWPLRVIKALAFEPRDVSGKLSLWRGVCENLSGLLFDAPPPDERPGSQGGSGRRFDWHALAQLAHGGLLAGLPPTILAGGLNPANVARAIETVSPYAVDVASGVETDTGKKDHQLIEQFCRAVRDADQALTPAG